MSIRYFIRNEGPTTGAGGELMTMSGSTVIPLRAAARTAEHRTVSRVMAVLEVVMASEPAGLRLADLAEIIGAPKSSIHGLARGLVAAGHLREHQGRYYRGPAVAMLGIGPDPVPIAFHQALQDLSRTWSETAILATLAGESVINIDIVEPNQTIRALPPLHERRPIWPGSYGKIFLAFMDGRRRDSYLQRKHGSPGEQAHIRTELDQVRATGIAYSRGELSPELFGVAGAIKTANGEVTLAIGLAGPGTRMTAHLDKIAEGVLITAQRLSGHT